GAELPRDADPRAVAVPRVRPRRRFPAVERAELNRGPRRARPRLTQVRLHEVVRVREGALLVVVARRRAREVPAQLVRGEVRDADADREETRPGQEIAVPP